MIYIVNNVSGGESVVVFGPMLQFAIDRGDAIGTVFITPFYSAAAFATLNYCRHINKNELTAVPTEALSYVPLLRKLILRSNQIPTLSADMFDGLPYLNWL